MMSLINNLLTGLLGPYYKYKARTFTHGPRKLKSYEKIGLCISWYGPSNLVSKFLIINYIQLRKKYSCLQLPWQLSYHSNEVCGYSLSSYITSILHINVIQLKKKGLWRYHCGFQGNQATIATGCVASRHSPKKPLYQI